MIFQCLSIAVHALFQRPRGSSVIVVISPLQLLLKAQLCHLNDFGDPAIAHSAGPNKRQLATHLYMALLSDSS